jgi:HK97 gp10 family phage protein
MAGGHEVKIAGVKELSRKLKALPDVVERAARAAVKAETEAVADDMRRGAPRLSGKLAEGIQAEFDAKTITGKAVSTADHTKYVVHGTSDTPANDFMTPAARRSEKRLMQRVTDEVRAELRKLAR